MTKLAPARGFECEQVSDGLLVCRLEGGEIEFAERDGRWFAKVAYGEGRYTSIGPFAEPCDAAYRMTHGVVPKRLAELLVLNGILAKEEA